MTHNAKKNYYDWRVYQHFLMENNLLDDSETITVEDLSKYIKNSISEEDYDRLYEFCYEGY